jgi:hypothetical protein
MEKIFLNHECSCTCVFQTNKQFSCRKFVRQNNVLGIAIHYGLDSQEVEFRWDDISPPPPSVELPLQFTQAPIQWVPGIFLGVK